MKRVTVNHTFDLSSAHPLELVSRKADSSPQFCVLNTVLCAEASLPGFPF